MTWMRTLGISFVLLLVINGLQVKSGLFRVHRGIAHAKRGPKLTFCFPRLPQTAG